MKPTELPLAALIRAIRPAQSGATALVPPELNHTPSTRTFHPVAGSASPLTSGVPRLESGVGLPPDLVTCRPFCQDGRANTALTPPPVAPPSWFQTNSFPEGWTVVP